MIFSSRFSKFGRGKNLSCKMKGNEIDIYYYDNGLKKKIVKIEDNKFVLTQEKVNLGYHEVCEVGDYLVTRISNNLGVILNDDAV